MDQRLAELLEAARHRTMSSEELEAQRINFAFGNAATADVGSTVESVKAAAEYLRKAEPR